jgi:hypothetical protein
MNGKIQTEENEVRRNSVHSKGSAQSGPLPKIQVNIIGNKQSMGSWTFTLSVKDGKRVIKEKLPKKYSEFEALDQLLESKYTQ